jgi:type I restriction enzyme, S subunit
VIGVTRLKYVASIAFSGVDKKSSEGEVPVQLCNYTDVYNHPRLTGDLEFMRATASPEEYRRFALRTGDILITKDSETPEDIAVAAQVVTELPRDVICGYHLAVIRPDHSRVMPRYLYWCFGSERTRQYFASCANGVTRFALRQEAVGMMPLTLPSLKAQSEIATLLDHQTERIDAAIAAKRRLLGLLDERFMAAIYGRVVGAEREGPWKASGLVWLETVPSHWDVVPVAMRYEVQLGRMLNAERAFGPNMAPYLRNVNVQWRRARMADLDEMDFPAAERARYRLRAGDLLVCEGGEVGRACIWRGELDECFYQKAIHRLRARSDDDPRFLMYTLWAMSRLGVFDADGSQTTIAHLTAEKLARHRVPFPPPKEQGAIADQLDREAEQTERIHSLINSQLQMLEESRRSLITELVAGRLPGRTAELELERLSVAAPQ